MMRSMILGLMLTALPPVVAAAVTGEANFVADSFHAECDACNWRGPRHDEYQHAQNDADSHQSANPGHTVVVVQD